MRGAQECNLEPLSPLGRGAGVRGATPANSDEFAMLRPLIPALRKSYTISCLRAPFSPRGRRGFRVLLATRLAARGLARAIAVQSLFLASPLGEGALNGAPKTKKGATLFDQPRTFHGVSNQTTETLC